MVRHSHSKHMLLAAAVAALGLTVASCGADKSSLVGPQPLGASAATAAQPDNPGVITQLFPFFYPDGTQVISANGEPDDAVLNRFADTPKKKIIWQFMTQHLTPGTVYDVWLEGSNDGADSFNWWVGSVKANAGGDANTSQPVYVGEKPGPGTGILTNPLARVTLVIKTTSGATMQTAYFPAP